MKNTMLNIAWWTLTIGLTPYILLLTLLGVLFVWSDAVFTKISSTLDALDVWRYNLFKVAV
jgi:hypothetical protein